MDTNKFKKVLLITAIPFFIAATCNKNDTKPCINGGYAFAATSFWVQEREIYNVNDTIFLYSEISKTLIDLINPSIVVDYINSVGIVGDIGLGYLDTITKKIVPAKDSFSFISIKGNFIPRTINQDQGINYTYLETSNNYQFKGAIICRRKGIYSFGVSNLVSNGLSGKNCTNANFDMTVTNGNKHLYFHQYAIGVNPNDPVLQKTGYDFRVQ